MKEKEKKNYWVNRKGREPLFEAVIKLNCVGRQRFLLSLTTKKNDGFLIGDVIDLSSFDSDGLESFFFRVKFGAWRSSGKK